MKKIYLTRHGETLWNVEKRFQGQIDIELNEKGIEQAKELQAKIAEYKIDKAFTSPSKRAFITAKTALEGRNIPVITDSRILEMKLGDWEGCLYEEVHGKFGKDSEDFWNNPSVFQREGVETFQSILKRTREFLLDLYKEEGEGFLIVSHGITTRALTAPFDDRNVENFWERDRLINHCSITTIEFDKDLNGKILSWAEGGEFYKGN